MKIGFNIQFKDKYLSGVERYSIGIVNSLCKYYPENEYFVFTNSPEYFKKPSVVIANKKTNRLKRIIWEHTFLPELAKRYNLDLLHCPHYICPLRKAAVPYIVTIHDTLALEHPGWCTVLNAVYYQIFLRLTARAASKIIAVSQETQDRIIASLKVTSKKTVKAYPGIDEVFFNEKPKKELNKIRDKYCLPEKYLLYVGNIEPKKNIKHILDAFMLYQSCDNDCGLVFVGKRNWKSQKMLSLLNNTRGVTLTGYISDYELACVYQMADVLLFPSRYEGFGFPPLEAMASGTPVICSKNGALKETVSETAFIVDCDKPVSTYNGIIQLNRNKDLREKLISKGRILSRKFAWSETARQIGDIYKRIVCEN